MTKKYLKYTQMMNFEIGDKCNLTGIHSKCPSNVVRQGKELTDEVILSLVNEVYTKYGFRGFLAWHYYNEPMLQANRIFNLMEQIRKEFPESRFLLWTNCTILPKDNRIKFFEKAFCTDYLNVGYSKLLEYFKEGCDVWYKGKDTLLDGRLVTSLGEVSFVRCLRPFVDLIIDNYGTVPLCCFDWQNTVKVGNIWENSLEEILEAREIIRKKICGKEMLKDAPERCLRCQCRENDATTGGFRYALGEVIAEETIKYLEEDSQNVCSITMDTEKCE